MAEITKAELTFSDVYWLHGILEATQVHIGGISRSPLGRHGPAGDAIAFTIDNIPVSGANGSDSTGFSYRATSWANITWNSNIRSGDGNTFRPGVWNITCRIDFPSIDYHIEHRLSVDLSSPIINIPFRETLSGLDSELAPILRDLRCSSHYVFQHQDHAPTGFGLWIDLNADGDPATVRLTNEFDHLLSYNAQWGRSEASYLAKVASLKGQAILSNPDGRYDPGRMLPGARIWLDYGEGGIGGEVVHGFVNQVLPSANHGNDLHHVVVHFEGALARLARDDHEVSFFTEVDVHSGRMMDDLLTLAQWPADKRMIDHGQVRLLRAHYRDLAVPRVLHRTTRNIRGIEEAEVGLVHELRGDYVVFEDKFHRLLDVRLSAWAFGTAGGPDSTPPTIRPIGTVTPNDSWANLYTVVRAGIQGALVQGDGLVYTFRKGSIERQPFRVPAGKSYTITCSMEDSPEYLENPAVRSVASWNPLLPEHYTLRGGTIRIGEQTRSSQEVIITAAADTEAVLTKLELHGRGIFANGDFIIPDLVDPDAFRLYNSRVLNIELGVLASEKDLVPQGQEFAQLLLYRYSKPQRSARLPFNPLLYPEAMTGLHISDPVLVQDGIATGLGAGGYRVEGGDISFEALTGLWEMGINVSARDRKLTVRDTELSYTATPGWQVPAGAPAQAITDSQHVIGIECSYPEGTARFSTDEPVLRVLLGRDIIREWTEQEIPIGEPAFLGVLTRGPGNVTIQAQAQNRLGLSISKFRIVRLTP